MRRRARVDANHGEIRDALRKCGWLVMDTSACGGGVPDLLVWKPGRVLLVEVKVRKGTYTPAQKKAIDQGWEFVTLRSVDDALAL